MGSPRARPLPKAEDNTAVHPTTRSRIGPGDAGASHDLSDGDSSYHVFIHGTRGQRDS
ncbi:hypothetical protein CGMCC3_g5338 [Colletotrichum fructicola]|nr:uncharacterized protein CGMCC3_g5338 [Colletotrichum fructicola]KAE9578985.1 hypothetical protein CGMCC3_g5338 [Colletotrichum fructicola]